MAAVRKGACNQVRLPHLCTYPKSAWAEKFARPRPLPVQHSDSVRPRDSANAERRRSGRAEHCPFCTCTQGANRVCLEKQEGPLLAPSAIWRSLVQVNSPRVSVITDRVQDPMSVQDFSHRASAAESTSVGVYVILVAFRRHSMWPHRSIPPKPA